MGVSARILGQPYGLTAQEMNRALVELGYLEGTPGAYVPTEKGLPFVTEKDFHRGNGGYARYNAHWTTRTFDERIRQELKITPELMQKIRSDLAASRAANRQARTAAASQAFQAKIDAEANAARLAEEAAARAARNVVKLEKAGKYALILLGIACVSYCAYKLIPVVRKQINKRRKKPRKE